MKKVIILILGILIAGSGFFLANEGAIPPEIIKETKQDTATEQAILDEVEKSKPLYVVQLDEDVGLLFHHNITRENGSAERGSYVTDEEILSLKKTLISEIKDSGDFGAVLNMIHTDDLNILVFNMELIPGVYTYKYTVDSGKLQIILRDKDTTSVPYFFDITDNGRYLAYSLYYWYSENPPEDVILYDTIAGTQKNIGVVTDFKWLGNDGSYQYKTCDLEGDGEYASCLDASNNNYISGTF